ncbi:MAG: class I SAM-dependent methyltransferase [Ruminococcus sp.]|nr:class I SAM-dependent methyltransferase [Ruminococcus sp.]
MIWDKVAPLYDMFETLSNNKVFNGTGRVVAEEISADDCVLECACGTGAISKFIAPKCRELIATDMSEKMLRETYMKCRAFGNVRLGRSDIMHLRFRDGRFDKVVAGNVIHLLDDPYGALAELLRVCKSGGKVIIPTYINSDNNSLRTAQSVLEKVGFEFKSEFDIESYKAFFSGAGLTDVEYRVVEGNCPCAVAIITKE